MSKTTEIGQNGSICSLCHTGRECGTGPDASGRFVWFLGRVREGIDFE
jgi:hypothetical protein